MGPGVSGSATFTVASYAFLRHVVGSVARRYNFPPPIGHPGWSAQAVNEWISDVFWPKKGTEAVIRVQLESTSDDSAEAILRTIVHNLLRDEARATVVGKLLERLHGVISKQGDLVSAAELTGGTASWTLPQLGEAVYEGDWTDLLRAPSLRSVPALSPLNTSGPTSAANSRALATAARTLVEVAGGAVRAADLARAIVQLYELDEPIVETLEPGVEGAPTTAAISPGQPGRRLDHVAAADLIWAQLELPDVLLLPYLGTSAAVASRRVPEVSNPRRRLPAVKSRLRELLQDHDDQDEILGIVLARAEDFAHTRQTQQ